MLAKLKNFAAGGLPASLRSAVPSAAALTKLLPIVLLAIGLTVVATLYMSYDEASYKPVFGAREQVSLNDMVSVLDAEGIPYRIHPDTGQVLVPGSKLGRVRLLLAAKGITAKLPPGLEQVDQSDPLGTSQFVQDVRFRRGLENELAQSVATLDPVEKARVHISQAKSSSFVISDGEKSSASVVLTLKPGRHLSKEQIAAVINLVAGSVANLPPQRVSVIDQTGALLSAHVDLDDDLIGGGSDAAARIREQTVRNVQDLLAPTVGIDNFRVSVTADVNDDRVEETREQYGDAPKVANESTREEQSRDRLALGVPGSLSNVPVEAPAASDATADSGTTTRNASARQYTYDRNITQIKRSRGRLEKLSVAVVLNNGAAPVAGKPWTPEQLARIEGILRNGLGLSEARGDQLVVSSLDFVKAPPAVAWWMDQDNWWEWAKYGGYAFLGLLVFLLVVRPLLRMLQQWVGYRYGPARQDELSQQQLPAPETLEEAQEATALPAPAEQDGRGVRRNAIPLLDNDVELPPSDSGVEVWIEHLRSLTERESERVAEVVKQWIQKSGNVSQQ